MASRIENATKQFGVNLLFSGQLYELLTDKCKTNMRHIDTVIVKGSSEPTKLYTCDVDTSKLATYDYETTEERILVKSHKKLFK